MLGIPPAVSDTSAAREPVAASVYAEMAAAGGASRLAL